MAARSKEQFDSNLVSVPLPFKAEGIERYATSIYHVSHKRQETASPIETLTAYRDGDKEYLMAAYTCTPVVRINLNGQTDTGELVGRYVPHAHSSEEVFGVSGLVFGQGDTPDTKHQTPDT